ILVPVREDERLNPVPLQLPQVRNDQVHAEQFRLGEHDAGVDEDRRLAAGDEHHVHAELAEPAERDQLAWPHTTSGLPTLSPTLEIQLDDTDMRRTGKPRQAPA